MTQPALAGQAVLVTGGATGLGRAIADRLFAEGARVHICDVNPDYLAAFRREQPGIGATLADIGDPRAVDRLFAEAAETLGTLTGLVNNVGVAGPVGRVETLPLDQWKAAVDVNLTGTFLCLQRAIPLLRKARGGSIVNMSSVAGRVGFAMRASYCSTKWSLVGLTKAVALEVGPENIRVNAVLPGACDTDRLDRVLRARVDAEGRSYDELHREAEQMCALQRLVDPAEVAGTVAFLLSPAGSGITGQAISVCGGALS